MAEAELRAQLSGAAGSEVSGSLAARILAHLRASRLPRGDLVLRHGASALSYLGPSTREWWDAAAQICLWAGSAGDFPRMSGLVDRIVGRFPHSARAFVLVGLRDEARGRWGEAMRRYMEVTAKVPLAAGVYKRQVAVLKSEGRQGEAVALLSYYVTMFGEDRDAWAELCAMALGLGRLGHAAFAANELVVLEGGDHAAHCLVAEVYMTAGGVEAVRLARGHYAGSLMRRKRGNVRGLFGLWLACARLEGAGDEEEEGKNEKLRGVAEAGLAKVYGHGVMGGVVRDLVARSVVSGQERDK